jgi:lipoprotein-anchoring transpeptidase ErfK/SrfK
MRPWLPMLMLVLTPAAAPADPGRDVRGPVSAGPVPRQMQPQQDGASPHVPAAPMPALDLQVLLDRAGFSPGEIDGLGGYNTRRALEGFQRARQLPATGRADPAVLGTLGAGDTPTIIEYTITADDLAGPFTPVIPADLLLQAALPALGYTGPLEMFGERFHASPSLLQRLNRGATFQTVGEVIRVPNVPPAPPPAAPGTDGHAGVVVTVSKSARVLRVEGADGAVLLQAPVTVGSDHDPLPIGEWAVTGLRSNPVFHYNPELFWDAEPSHSKAHIQPGPNSPVGVMWIGVTREHYGLHGTPEPSRVGHTESHGCVRLTNWDVLRLAAHVTKGTQVVFEE